MSVKKRAKQIYHKGHHHAKKIAQRGTAIMFALILFVGILLPAGVGYAMDKMDGVAVNTLIACSSDVNSSAITFSGINYNTFPTAPSVASMDGRDYIMIPDGDGHTNYDVIINESTLKNTDKVRIIIHSDSMNMANWTGYVFLYEKSNIRMDSYREYDNQSNSVIYDIPITPAILLNTEGDCRFRVEGIEGFAGQDASGSIVDIRYELYDAKGIDANSTKTMFLAGSGILMLIAGLCATPWINPSEIARKKGWL